MKEWVKLPTEVFRDVAQSPLSGMTWVGQSKSDYISALMVYIVLVHHANDHDSISSGTKGTVSLSYEKLCDLTGVSRTKVSKGLKVLESVSMIEKGFIGRVNVYSITNFLCTSGWAKLPAKGLYNKGMSRVEAFASFKLSSEIELHALKIILIIAAFRDNATNHTQLSYEKISEYSFVQKNDIKSALSLLVANKLIQVDSIPTELNEFSTSNVYRLCHLEVHKHRGTIGRTTLATTS